MSKPFKIAAIRGMHDILPPESSRWQFLEQKAREIFSRYGFGEVRTPIVESTELFARSIGEVTDIVEKEMYTFQDRKGKSLTLRPEGTASVVRAVIEAGLLGKEGGEGPIHKFYYMGPMFRYERPQKGRQRQFFQIGAEVFGDAGPWIDAEMLTLCAQFLQELDLTQWVKLEINSLGNAKSRGEYLNILRQYFTARKEKLCGDCQRRLESNALRILDCKVPTCIELARGAPAILSHIDPQSKAHFDSLCTALSALGIPYQINERMVRGLDYYTGTTFEWVTDQLGAQGAVLAGGRYDRLVEDLGGPPIPAIGFAAGMERLVLLLEQSGLALSSLDAQVSVVSLGAAAKLFALQLLQHLRHASVHAQAELRDKSLKAQLRHADRHHAAFVVLVGDDELKQNKVILKNMHVGTQEEISFSGSGQTLNWAELIANLCQQIIR